MEGAGYAGEPDAEDEGEEEEADGETEAEEEVSTEEEEDEEAEEGQEGEVREEEEEYEEGEAAGEAAGGDSSTSASTSSFFLRRLRGRLSVPQGTHLVLPCSHSDAPPQTRHSLGRLACWHFVSFHFVPPTSISRVIPSLSLRT